MLGLRHCGPEAQDLEVLICWVDFGPEDATWERATEITDRFPTFHLEDKVKLWGAGIDRPSVTQVYERRRQKKNKD